MKVYSKNISTIHHGEQWTPYDKNGFIYFGSVKREMKVFKTKKECDEFIKIKSNWLIKNKNFNLINHYYDG